MSHFKILLSLLTIIQTQTTVLPVDEYPDPESPYVYLIDTETNQILFAENSEERMYPASLTKMMAEIVAIESLADRMDDTITITYEMLAGLAEANASVAGFQVGDTVTVMDLLYGCALPSGADCIQALAILTDESVPAFVQHMNQKAQELGMYQTNFVNATGLHHDDHYSTAEDMAILLTYCLNNDIFKQVFSAHQYTSTPVDSHPNGLYMNSTMWSTIDHLGLTIPGLYGGKTGYTIPAGRCLATAANINGMHLVLVTGKASGAGAITDANMIYHWVEDHYQRVQLLEAYDSFSISVIDGEDEEAYIITTDTIETDIPTNATITYNIDIDSELQAPLSRYEAIGSLDIYVDDTYYTSVSLYPDKDVTYSTKKHIVRITRNFFYTYRYLFVGIGLLLLFLKFLKRKRHRKRRKYQKKRISR